MFILEITPWLYDVLFYMGVCPNLLLHYVLASITCLSVCACILLLYYLTNLL